DGPSLLGDRVHLLGDLGLRFCSCSSVVDLLPTLVNNIFEEKSLA
ncbi:hypothetical protein PF010_g33177, partial [Phytophthora fragariae]